MKLNIWPLCSRLPGIGGGWAFKPIGRAQRSCHSTVTQRRCAPRDVVTGERSRSGLMQPGSNLIPSFCSTLLARPAQRCSVSGLSIWCQWDTASLTLFTRGAAGLDTQFTATERFGVSLKSHFSSILQLRFRIKNCNHFKFKWCRGKNCQVQHPRLTF